MAQKAGTPDMKENTASQTAPEIKTAPSPGTNPGAGARAATASGTNPGAGAAAKSETNPGAGAATTSGTNPGADAAAKSGMNPGAGPAAAPGSNPTAGKNNLFREKSLERIENPEKLNDYLRVTNPGVWLVLATVIVLLAGACVWGIFGRITATSPVAVVTQDGESICLVPQAAIEGVIANRVVTVDGSDYSLTPSVLEPEVISETTNVYTMLAGQLSV